MKSLVDFRLLSKTIVDASLPKPPSGTLSGHAAGEPFDPEVYKRLQDLYKEKVFRQYEYLNFLYTKNPGAVGVEERKKLFDSPTVLFLLSRGDSATKAWSFENPFEEKQNDTADILVVVENRFNLIDVKTRNISKSAQAPNIISAYKLARLCAIMLDNEEFDSFTIDYFEVDWQLRNDRLHCVKAHHANLFKVKPETLYINWAAAMQIQFHVVDCDQTFTGTYKEWAIEYLRHFIQNAEQRANSMIEKFVTPFKKYIVQ